MGSQKKQSFYSHIFDFTGFDAWNAIAGFFFLGEAIALQKVVKQLPENSIAVELGCFQGRSSVAIAAALPAGSMLHCVDRFQSTARYKEEKRPSQKEIIWSVDRAIFVVPSETAIASARYNF